MNVGRDVRLRDSVIRFSPANERDIPPSRPSLCGSCIIRLSLLNPRSNLKSEEKLDSLIGQERKSRLGRREPLIKSYRLPLPSQNPRTANFRPEGATDFPSSFFVRRATYSFFLPPSYRRVLNDSRRFYRLISRPLLICFNYTAHR